MNSILSNTLPYDPADCCQSCGVYNKPGDDISIATMLRPDGHLLQAEFCRSCWHSGAALGVIADIAQIPTAMLDRAVEGRL